MQRREQDGRYAHTGDWDRLCVCGHTLGYHGAGTPADCLLYSFPEPDMSKQLNKEVDCGCERFRLSRKKVA